MGKRELVALLGLSSWCLVMVVWLFFAVPRVFLRVVIVAISDHTHLLFLKLFFMEMIQNFHLYVGPTMTYFKLLTSTLRYQAFFLFR